MSSIVALAGGADPNEIRRVALAPVSLLAERANCGMALAHRLRVAHLPPTFSEPTGQEHCPLTSTKPAKQPTVTSCVLLLHSWSPTLSVIDQSPVAGKVVATPGATSTVLFFGTATILALATPGGCVTLTVMTELLVPRRELLPAVSNKANVSQGVGIGMQTPLVFWWPGGHSQPPLGV